MSDKTVSASRVINAPAQKIFDVLADPTQHAAIDGEGTVQGVRDGAPQRLSLGARFGMEMKIGAPYRITNEVVEFDEGKRIAWQHFGKHIWRYELEPVEDGMTKVTETFDYTKARSALVLQLLGYPRKHAKGIPASLERLDAHVTATS